VEYRVEVIEVDVQLRHQLDVAMRKCFAGDNHSTMETLAWRKTGEFSNGQMVSGRK